MAYNITSRSQLIDIATISSGCDQVEAAAKKFSECAAAIKSASGICNANALSVDKTTMQPQLDADAEYIESMEAAAVSFTTELRSIALKTYTAQEAELADYIAKQQAAKNATNGSN